MLPGADLNYSTQYLEGTLLSTPARNHGKGESEHLQFMIVEKL